MTVQELYELLGDLSKRYVSWEVEWDIPFGYKGPLRFHINENSVTIEPDYQLLDMLEKGKDVKPSNP